MAKNYFIVIEGVDGVGKSTVIDILAHKIGVQPTATPIGFLRRHRRIVEESHPDLRYLYYLVANYIGDFYIRKLLKKTSLVCERYYHSTKIFHIVYGSFLARLVPLRWNGSIMPDVVYFLAVDQKNREQRIAQRQIKTKKDMDSAALSRVQEEFMKYADLIIINTNGLSPEEVADKIRIDYLERLIKNPG